MHYLQRSSTEVSLLPQGIRLDHEQFQYSAANKALGLTGAAKPNPEHTSAQWPGFSFQQVRQLFPQHVVALVAGSRAKAGFSSFGDNNSEDCFGHGTHVSGIIGGLTYGVAKNATLHAGWCTKWNNILPNLHGHPCSVGMCMCCPLHLARCMPAGRPGQQRMESPMSRCPTVCVQKSDTYCAAVRCIDCNGDSAVDDIIAGLEWVAANFQFPAVASLSLGTSGTNDALDAAVLSIIQLGITAVIAAGNFGSGVHCLRCIVKACPKLADSVPLKWWLLTMVRLSLPLLADACNLSPARLPQCIAVAATDVSDTRWTGSNYGSCVDLYAPGVAITSAMWAFSGLLHFYKSCTAGTQRHQLRAGTSVCRCMPWSSRDFRYHL